MNITDVKVRLIKKEDDRLKAVASITIDNCFAVHDIKIIDGKDGLFVAMPTRKNKEGEYKDIAHPINTETRNNLCNLVMAAYEAASKTEQIDDALPSLV